MNSTRTRRLIFVLIVLFFIGINFFLFSVGQERVTEFVGIKNSYLVTFFTAAIGGLSTFGAGAFLSVMATFAAGGAHPALLGIAGGLGLFISDSIFFLAAHYGTRAVPVRWMRVIHMLERWVQKFPFFLVACLVFVYLAFTPLPNDLIAIALVVAGYRYRAVAPVLFLGSVTHAFILAYLGHWWL